MSDAPPTPVVPHSRPWIAADDRAAVDAALASDMVASGGGAKRFERAVLRHLDREAGTATATSSGTEALRLALLALGAVPGDEVILPTYCCGSVERAIRATGATPVPCDIGRHWHATAASVAPRLTARTRAVVLVSPFGILADPRPVAALGVPVVEDLCQAFPPAGFPLHGAAAVFSFHATKCLTTGEGGMAVAREGLPAEAFAAACARGAISPLSDLSAALGESQLARYPAMLARRRDLADRFFAALPAQATSRLAEVRDRTIFFRFPILHDGDFGALQAAFLARGVAVRRGVDALLHRAAGLADDDFPGATDLFRRTVSVPLHPSLTPEETSTLLAACRDLL